MFVELAPNPAGLAELRDGDREMAQALVGRTAAVFIKSITPERMKVKLVLIDACRNEPLPAPGWIISSEATASRILTDGSILPSAPNGLWERPFRNASADPVLSQATTRQGYNKAKMKRGSLFSQRASLELVIDSN